MARVRDSAVTARTRLNVIVVQDRCRPGIYFDGGGLQRMWHCYPYGPSRTAVVIMAHKWDSLTFAEWRND